MPDDPGNALSQPDGHAGSDNLAAFEIRQESFAGPLPPPATLADYDRVVPGAAERILVMAEREQAHKHALQRDLAAARMGAQRMGQRSAWTIGGIAVIGGLLVLGFGQGKEGFGLAAVMSAIAGLVAVFLYGRSRAGRGRRTKGTTKGGP